VHSAIQYNFKTIPIVPTGNELIDIILSKTQRKTPTVVHPQYNIQRIRKFYMRKVKFTNQSINEKIQSILDGFPKLDDIHPFYSDLINILYDKDHYKMGLGYVNQAKNICEKISNDYLKLMKYAESLYRCKQLKRAALGRMATTLKKLNSTLTYLEEVRKHLSRLPCIDPNSRTLILCGFPNVGKSSFMNHITNANSEVQPYPFTTQSLYCGHTFYKHLQWQVIDTPGVLDRPLEERNNIEMQAITALAHLDACIIYFLDISEICGYSIAEQLKLFSSIKPLFKHKPLVLVLNKIDIRKYEDLSVEEKKSIEDTTKENNAFLIQMSNVKGDGVSEVKAKSCEILLEYRLTNKTTGKGEKIPNVMNRIHVALPKPRDDKIRPPHIPENLKCNAANFEFNEETLEKKLVKNSVRELIEKNGGNSVFYFPDRTHFILDREEWRNDIMPEIMDGKNIMDFVDPEIEKRLERLEEEEDRYLERMYQSKALENGNDDDELSLDEELLEAHGKMMSNKVKLQKSHQLVIGSQLPKKVRGLTETEELMQKIRWDKGDLGAKFLTQKTKRNDKIIRRKSTSQKNSMIQSQKDDEDVDVEMNLDDPDYANKVKILENRKKDEAQKKIMVQRIKNKIQKKLSREARVDTADRRVGTKLPRHLNSGHRGIGKTDYR
jgi:nucleolar GTP-binding protein